MMVRGVPPVRLVFALTLSIAVAALVHASPARASSCIPGFDHAAFGKNSVTFGGGATTDSYDSTPPGTYSSTHSNSNGNIGSNGCTSPTAVTLNGAPTTINGDVAIGAGCSTSSGVSPGASTINGTSSSQSTNTNLPSVTIPTVGTPQGNVSSGSHATVNLTPDETYGTVSIKSHSHLILSAGTYVIDSLTLSGNADLQVASAPVLVYITTSMDLTGGTVSNPSLKATDLVFMVGPSATDIKVTGGTQSAFAVYAPDTQVKLAGNADFYGAIVGETVDATGGAAIHYDRSLGSFEGGGFSCDAETIEVSRSSPIIAYAGSTLSEYQGTYEATDPPTTAPTLAAGATLADAQSWTFPAVKGHFRAVPVGSVSSTATLLSELASPVFDAAELIPPATNSWTGSGCSRFTTGCRTVFTNVAGGLRPTRTIIEQSNSSSVGALLGITDTGAQDELLKRVLGLTSSGTSSPTLGGIDRSTSAVIEASTVAAGGGSRPTMVYVGGRDGMLHAICASVSGECTQLGVELWAFLPRTQLPYLRTNSALVNGSPKVADVYGDFDGSGQNAFRTILTFQTGGGDPSTSGGTPAVYALDVTDPTDPTIVWEYTTPASRGGYELGVGLNVAMGPVSISNVATDVTIAQTNNGGTAGAGTNVFALNTETGAVVWEWDYLYPSPRSVSIDVPATGIPGGVAATDPNATGYLTDVLVGTLYGNLFQLDASTGRSRYGSSPSTNPCVASACKALYQFSSDYHPIGAPPTIFSDGVGEYVVVASGGYADDAGASGTGTALTWSPATTHQYLISISLLTTPTSTPLSSTSAGGLIHVATDLGAGNRVYSQVQVAGNDVFVTTDSASINDLSSYGTGDTSSGKVIRIGLDTGTLASTVVVVGGAGSVDVSSGSAYVASGNSTQTATTGTASGTRVELDSTTASPVRAVWISN